MDECKGKTHADYIPRMKLLRQKFELEEGKQNEISGHRKTNENKKNKRKSKFSNEGEGEKPQTHTLLIGKQRVNVG